MEQVKFGHMDWNKDYAYNYVQHNLLVRAPVELKLIFSGDNNDITPSGEISFDVQYNSTSRISTSQMGNETKMFRNITLSVIDPPPPIWTVLHQNVITHD